MDTARPTAVTREASVSSTKAHASISRGGITDLRWHDRRHEAGSRLIEAGEHHTESREEPRADERNNGAEHQQDPRIRGDIVQQRHQRGDQDVGGSAPEVTQALAKGFERVGLASLRAESEKLAQQGSANARKERLSERSTYV